MDDLKYLIYGLIDPITHKLRYIGKSSSGLVRPKAHWKPCNLLKDDSHCGRWIKLIRQQELFPEIIILEQFDTFDFNCLIYHDQLKTLNQAEQFWIAFYRKNGFDLTNMTDGGDGQIGMSPELRAKISYMRKHAICSEETRKKLSIAAKLRPKSDNWWKRMKENHPRHWKGKKFSDEARINMSRAGGGKPIEEINSGVVYQTINEAVRKLNLCGYALVKNSLKFGHIVYGKYKFKYVGEPEIINLRSYGKSKNDIKMAVRELSTGQEFDNVRLAAKILGIGATTIHRCLKENRWTKDKRFYFERIYPNQSLDKDLNEVKMEYLS